MKRVTCWTCPKCGARLTLYVPPRAAPICAHTGRRQVPACEMIEDEGDEAA